MSMKKKKNEGQYTPSRITIKQPRLSHEFVMRVLAGEQRCKKHISEQSIMALLNDYKKLIEFYSSKQDPIAIYFTEKMSNLLCCQASLETLDKQTEQVTTSMAEEALSSQLTDFKDVSSWGASKYDLESKRKERSKKVQITLEVHKTHKRSNARNLLNRYYEECLDNNNLIMNQIQQQKKDLEDRLRALHNRSQQLQTVNGKGPLSVYIS